MEVSNGNASEPEDEGSFDVIREAIFAALSALPDVDFPMDQPATPVEDVPMDQPETTVDQEEDMPMEEAEAQPDVPEEPVTQVDSEPAEAVSPEEDLPVIHVRGATPLEEAEPLPCDARESPLETPWAPTGARRGSTR
ncbi:Uu.00g109120.m01.CDS01 [Anthostomella pinea]|uniref:Uu.00g109120.m01.CDS01 n=1 Tax=Anthostomella pinea TaxID=933095 RepID=A0AAI8VFL8_9PEZI|nr:Uu.00g109120.m01.CDS01 [Anthostomella pinea]